MNDERPFVVCLCPTYNRLPGLVENSVACFLAQTYPAERRRLVVLDDSGRRPNQLGGDGWAVISTQKRLPNLGLKYNAMVALAPDADVYVVWEDDDVYLPWHIEAHVHAIQEADWSMASAHWTDYPGHLVQQVRPFHAAVAFQREIFDKTQGWPDGGRPDFDLEFLSRLKAAGARGDPFPQYNPSYVFRWGSTGNPHGEASARSPTDEGWYDRFARRQDRMTGSKVPGEIVPRLDDSTRQIFRLLVNAQPPRKPDRKHLIEQSITDSMT